MKLFIILIIASMGCSSSSNTTKKVEELRDLKTKYENLITEIDTKGQSLDRSVLTKKKKEAQQIASKMQLVEKQIDDIVIDLTYNTSFEKGADKPRFKIKSVNQQDESLTVDLQYSGGCGDPHQFELITNGSVDENGIVDFHLVDKTTGDNCKMMLMKTKHFNIAKINKKAAIKGFRLNDSKVTSISRSK